MGKAKAHPAALAPAAKKQRVSQQPGIAAAFAVAAAAAAQPPPPDMPLEQRRSREQLERRLTEELSSQGDKYLQAWSDKCYGMRDSATPKKAAAAAAAAGGSSYKARRASAASAYTRADTDLDSAGMRGWPGKVWHETACLPASLLSPSPPQLLVAAPTWPLLPQAAEPHVSPHPTRTPADMHSHAPAPAPAAALRYLDAFRHLQQQAFQQGAAFEARHLELLVLILRSDVLHAIGGALRFEEVCCAAPPAVPCAAAAARSPLAPCGLWPVTSVLCPPHAPLKPAAPQMCHTRPTPCFAPTCTASRTPPWRQQGRRRAVRGARCCCWMKGLPGSRWRQSREAAGCGCGCGCVAGEGVAVCVSVAVCAGMVVQPLESSELECNGASHHQAGPS